MTFDVFSKGYKCNVDKNHDKNYVTTISGEISDIMNTVLIAEKNAQANVIARREEVASDTEPSEHCKIA